MTTLLIYEDMRVQAELRYTDNLQAAVIYSITTLSPFLLSSL